MDEEAGTTVTDAAGSNQGLHVGAPVHEAGQVGRALRFDGTRSYVGVQDNDLWAFGPSEFTIELWANFATAGGGSVGGGGDVFVANDESQGTANKWFFAYGGGYLYFHINGPGIGDQFFNLVPFSPEIGRWYHLAIKRAGSTYTIFIDGDPAGTAENSIAIPNANALLTIGEAEGLFYMNGLLDEVTIYNRSLSDAELKAIAQAGSAGKCKPPKITTRVLTSAQLDKLYAQTLRAEFGTPPYSWTLASGNLPDGVSLSGAGLLSGTPKKTGKFNFVVSLRDDKGVTAESSLSLEVLLIPPPPQVRINMNGNIPVPGRSVDYFIWLENVGNVPADDFDVHTLLAPEKFTFISADPQLITDTLISNSDSIIGWNLTKLLPGESRLLTYKARLNASVSIGDAVIGGPAYVQMDRAKLSQCMWQALKASGTCTACIAVCSFAAAQCVAPPYAGCAPAIIGCASCMASCAEQVANVQQCEKDASGGDASVPKPVEGPTDPNEKLVVAKRFIRPDQLLAYPIHFENIGTVEARDIYLTDVLEPTLDVSTLNITSPKGASFDLATRTLRWDLFNVNLPPGETDNVHFAIRPVKDLPSGTVIRNKATIRFEVFEPLTTAEVENVIDSTPPTCTVDPLPAQTTTPEFNVSWKGTDPVGEIETYTVLVAINGANFQPFLEKTQLTGVTFPGQIGNSYQFICVATDTAGNTELQDTISETTTQVISGQLPRLINLSTRAQVGTGDNVLIGGLVIGGSTPHQVLIRAIGPSMASAGVSDTLANPQITLTKVTGEFVASNDNWQDDSQAGAIPAPMQPTHPNEAALLITLQPGVPYTPIVSGVGGTMGVALVEVYDVDDANTFSRLVNISTRARVGTGDKVMIGGFVIGGSQPKKVLIRAIGPSMVSAGVADTLANPNITLTKVTGEFVASNDNWQDGPNVAELQILGRQPAHPNESALLLVLQPNVPYTPIVDGVGGTQGVALVEVYEVP